VVQERARFVPDGEVHVFTADLDAAEPDDRILSEDELERAGKYRFDRDRRRFTAGRTILRGLVASYLGTRPDDVEFSYGAFGRPSASDSALSFNVAHSEGAALFAFADGMDVGVDVEVLAAGRPDDDRVAEKFFSRLEVRTLRAHGEAARPAAFLRCWTRKEAFLKARGDGLSLPLRDFDVAFAPGARPAILRTAWSEQEPAEWTLHDISDFCPRTVAALATRAASSVVLQGHID